MGRTAYFHAPGRPLELAAGPDPAPAGGEMLVRVSCCTLCRSDLHTHAGRRAEPTPLTLGHEIVGRITAFGPAAPRADAAGAPAAVGDRITWAVAVGCGDCFFCREELPQKCGRPYKYGHVRATAARPGGGGLADSVTLVPGTAWFRVPDAIPDRVAAPANCATATAAAALRAAGPVNGRVVVVLGAGVLGLTACAMARAAGAREVIAADPAEAARARALAFGATHAVDPAEVIAGAAELTDGRGADAVLELAGAAASVQTAVAATRTGGVVVLAGTVAPVGPVPIDPEQVVRRLLTIRGVHNYHPRDLAAALEFLAGPGRAYPFAELVIAEYPLAQVDAAFAAAHAHPGVRVAVVPGGGADIAARVFALFEERGRGAYFGEAVSETDHALQCAALAVQAGAGDSLVAAALLHDVGHLLHGLPEDIAGQGVDGGHEAGGAAWLAAAFGPAVTDPVRLHVAAKRYLCAVEPGYFAGLSPASRESLRLQGGPMAPAEVQAFEAEPRWRDAVALRRWDDAAKTPGLAVPGLSRYRSVLEAAAGGRE